MQEAVAGGGAWQQSWHWIPRRLRKPVKNRGIVSIANYNCPGQIVITGEEKAVAAAGELCKEAGAKRVVPLKVSGPFHSAMLKGAGEKLGEELKHVTVHTPAIPYVANVTADYVTKEEEIKPLLENRCPHLSAGSRRLSV